MRAVLALSLAMWASAAVAQTYGPTPATLPISGGTLTGAITAPSYNATGASGYLLNGQNAYNMVSNGGVVPTFTSGPYAGASQPTNGQWSQFIGLASFASNNAQVSESVGIGPNTGIFSTTGGANLMIGTVAGGGITTQNGDIFLNADAGRNYGGFGSDIGMGTGALNDGNGANSNFAFGSNTIHGAQSTITVAGGSPHAGDTYPITLSTSKACNGSSVVINCTTGAPVTYTYTVQAGDTTSALLAVNLANALTAGLNGIGYTLGNGVALSAVSLTGVTFRIFDATNHPTVLAGHYPWAFAMSVSLGSCTGTCAATLTLGPGFTGGNNIISGNTLFFNPLLTSASSNNITGMGGPSLWTTTLSYNNGMGTAAASLMTTATYNNWMGDHALAACAACSQNLTMGSYSGTSITGNGNTVLSDKTITGQSSITSGSHNLEVGGNGTAVPSPTASDQVSVQNAIYCTGASGTGATVSPGVCGVSNNAPTATWTIGDAGGTSTQGSHVAVTQTTAPVITGGSTVATLDANASDTAGTVTGGTLQTGWTLTFKVAYVTTPHCVVSSPSGNAFTSYTASTGTLVLANVSATGDKFSYVCVQ